MLLCSSRELCVPQIGVGVSIKGIYQGYLLQQVDDKGRVAIPSVLRATLIARSAVITDPKEAAHVIIGVHERDACLVGYDLPQAEPRFEALEARALQHAGPDGAPNDEILRSAMATDTVAFDASGRFILPNFPRTHVGIGKHAFFCGLGRHFEIWDPATAVASPRFSGPMRDYIIAEMVARGEPI